MNKKNVFNRKNFPLFIIIALILLYTIVFSVITIYNQNHFYYSAFDIGIFDQGVYLMSQGENPFVTVRGFHIFGDHVQFILLLIVPFYLIWSNIKLLLILQSFLLALGALPIYLIAREKFHNRYVPIIFSASYLLYPALQYLNLENFHPDCFAPVLLLFAFYFMMKKKYMYYFISIFLALITKEDIFVTVFVLGIFVFFFENKKIGIYTSLASVLWFIIGFYYILPFFNGGGYFHGLTGYSAFNSFGSSPVEAVKNVILNPSTVKDLLLTAENRKYVMNLFLPLGFLPLLAPEILGIAVPAILMNMLTGWPYARSIEYHYTKAIIPFMFIAIIFAFARLKKLKFSNKEFIAGLLIMFIMFSFIGNIMIGPNQSSIKNYNEVFNKFRNFNSYNEREKLIYNVMDKIPEDASVSATYLFVPHLSHRKTIYMFSNPFKQAYWGWMKPEVYDVPDKDVDYVFADLNTVSVEDKAQILDKLVIEGRYEKIFEGNNILLIKKI